MDSQPHEERTHRPDGQARGIFVGRQRELGELTAALEDALSGQGRLVMLAGEPGIGKTRTSRELAAHASLRGAQVLWGRCYEGQGAPPYWPWVQVVRSYVHGCDAAQLRSAMGPGAADIAEVVPEVRERLPDLEPPPVLEPQQARFRLFDSIAAFLKRASQAQPLVVVLDNLHWADPPSLQLLEFLAQELAESRLLLLGTCRDTELTRRHPLTQTLGDLAREPSFRRVPLRGLSLEEVDRYLQATAGFAPPRDLVGVVHAKTEGNPLFMTEVVRLLVQEGEITPEGGREGQGWNILIPAGVREAIGRRLDRLSQQCNQFLTVASVVGREFGLGLLERLMGHPSSGKGEASLAPTAGGLSSDELLEAVEEALAARVIEELPQVVDRYQFAHVLVQDTLARELSAARRARLHRRIAEALEELYGPNVEAHAAELAYHFVEAVTATDTRKLVHYSLLAGERALAIYAWEEALEHFQRGLEAKEGQDPSTGSRQAMDAETAALMFGLGRARGATLDRHQLPIAAEDLRCAFDYYAAVGNVPKAVAVAEYPLRALVGEATDVPGLIAHALALVQPDSHEAGRLLARYGAVLGLEEGDYDGAQEAFGRALAIAQREEDAALEMRTLAYATSVDYWHLHSQEVLEKGLRVIELARRIDDPHSELDARLEMSSVLRTMGDLEEAQRHAAAKLALAERLRDRTWLVTALWANELVCRDRGDWQAASHFSDRGLAVSSVDPRLLLTRILLEYGLGNPGQGESYLKRLLEVMPLTAPGPTFYRATMAMVIPMVARLSGRVDRFDVAEAAANAVLSSPSASPRVPMIARAGLGLLAVLRGDVAAAREQYTALMSAREGGFRAFTGGGGIATGRLLGLLAQTMGQLDKAAEHFEDALGFCRKAGYRPELAWTCFDYAEALVGAGFKPAPTPANRTRVVSLLEEALAISRQVGMRPLMQQVVALLERIELPPPVAPAYPDNLTQREVEVLRLVAAGKSNREIAEALIISLNTVGHHVSNILSKTGTVNRAGVATYAARHGLAR